MDSSSDLNASCLDEHRVTLDELLEIEIRMRLIFTEVSVNAYVQEVDLLSHRLLDAHKIEILSFATSDTNGHGHGHGRAKHFIGRAQLLRWEDVLSALMEKAPAPVLLAAEGGISVDVFASIVAAVLSCPSALESAGPRVRDAVGSVAPGLLETFHIL